MFRLIEPSSGQIQNIVLVHSVSAHIMGKGKGHPATGRGGPMGSG